VHDALDPNEHTARCGTVKAIRAFVVSNAASAEAADPFVTATAGS
jgi:hypothetical protein